MSRAAGLFSDEVMGYGAEAPQLGGYSGSLVGERVTDSLLPGGGVLPAGQKEEMLRLMSGGALRSRKTRRAGRKTKKVQRGGRRRTTKQGRKSFLNIRVTGQIRLKQRHRQ